MKTLLRPPPSAQRGIALVLVLWATTLLTVIAASFVFSMRTDTLLAQNLTSSARAQALADAGVQRAVYEAFKPNDPQRWRADGTVHEWSFGGGKVNVSLLDISGKIDLNVGSDLLLKGLLKSVGVDEERSNAIVDAIVDWRDADDLKRPNGAEAADYLAAGLKYVPSNAPFESVEELQRVLGMTPAIYARVADALTVDSRQGGINAQVASKKVLLALPGTDEPMVDAYLVARQEAAARQALPPAFPPANSAVAGYSGSVYSVRAEAVMPDGAVFVRDTVVKLNPAGMRKLAYLSWKEGVATPKPPGAKSAAEQGRP